MNEKNKKMFDLLTMCRRSGRMTMGFDSVKDSMTGHKAKLVILASDISAKTEKEIRFFADKTFTKVMKTEATIAEFEFGIGKKVGVIAVCDEGFAKKTAEILSV